VPTAPTLVQSKSGSALGTEGSTPVVASLDNAITPGNTVFILTSNPYMGVPSGNLPVLSSVPADFTVDLQTGYGSTVANAVCVLSKVMHVSEAASWDLVPFGIDKRVNWVVLEYSGLPPWPALVTYAVAAINVATAATPMITGTTGTLGHTGTFQLAVFASRTASNWSGYTNSFTELFDLNQTPSLAVASRYSESTAGVTLTALQTVDGNPCIGAVLVYEVADATFSAPLVHIDGFERGTPYGMSNTTNPTASTRAASAVSGTPGTDILVGSAYSAGPWSQAGLRIIAAAAFRYVQWDSNILGDLRDLAWGFHCRVVSSTGLVFLAEINPASGSTVRLLYDTATSKIGVRWLGGDAVWQDGTTAPGTWVWVDWRVGGFGGVARSMRWSLDGVEQPTPLNLGGGGGGSIAGVNLGAAVTQTATLDFDDLVVSRILASYPHTKHHVRLLTVDPAGTPSISGTAANFSVFTNNTTLAAWDPTNARNAVDEIPPTISASSDGVCQTVTAATDYAQFPMSTHVIAGPEVLTGVKMWAAAWGGTGAGGGTFEVRGHDGTSEASLFPAGTAWDPDSITTPSSTVPPWVTAMWLPAGGWTQAKLDAAALRFGYSSDATPDMGVHNLFLEAAIQANLPQLPVLQWRVDYTDGTSHQSAAGPPTVTTGVRGVILWHAAPYRTFDHGWSAYRIADVTLFGETEADETFEAWRLAIYDEPHPLA
jgi:hypothetical protein